MSEALCNPRSSSIFDERWRRTGNFLDLSVGNGVRKDEKRGDSDCSAYSKEGCNTDTFNGEGWWLRFMQRHPVLSLRTADPPFWVRANALTEENMKAYFDLLEKTLTDHGLLNWSSCIYNLDESGMRLDAKQLKQVAKKGMKKEQPIFWRQISITLVTCGNAAGTVLPPMLIFKGEWLNHKWTRSEVSNTPYRMSENGWIEQELFFYWLKDLFLKYFAIHRHTFSWDKGIK